MLPFPLPCAPTWITEGVCLQDDGKEVGVENRRQRRKARGVYRDCCLCMFAGPSQSCCVLPTFLSPKTTQIAKQLSFRADFSEIETQVFQGGRCMHLSPWLAFLSPSALSVSPPPQPAVQRRTAPCASFSCPLIPRTVMRSRTQSASWWGVSRSSFCNPLWLIHQMALFLESTY